MDKKILTFLKEQKNLTFCTSLNNVPHCVNCFYSFIEEFDSLVFKSDPTTQHIINALLNNKIAGTIVPDIHQTGTIKGIQFTGNFLIPANEILEIAKIKYYKKFPFALVMPGELWSIELTTIKMTDNTFGFGKKLVWVKRAIEKNDSLLKEST
jgi:uncharacterized protein